MDLLKSKHSNVIICKRLINTENVILLSYSQTDTRHFKTFSYMTWLQHSSVYNFSNLNSIEGLLLFALAFWSACDYDLKGRLITRLWSYRSYNTIHYVHSDQYLAADITAALIICFIHLGEHIYISVTFLCCIYYGRKVFFFFFRSLKLLASNCFKT